MKLLLLQVVTLAVCTHLVAGFSNRPFEKGSSPFKKACSTLTPQHGFDRKASSANFVLKADKLGNGKITVTVNANSGNFKGFIIQSSGVPGSFAGAGDTIVIDCDEGATIRHGNPQPKTSVTDIFTPAGSGTATFKGTVVVEYDDYYQLQPVSISI